MISMFKEYLGDGVYIEFIADYGQVRIWTERESGTHEIFFERMELNNLVTWISKLKKELNRE